MISNKDVIWTFEKKGNYEKNIKKKKERTHLMEIVT